MGVAGDTVACRESRVGGRRLSALLMKCKGKCHDKAAN